MRHALPQFHKSFSLRQLEPAHAFQNGSTPGWGHNGRWGACTVTVVGKPSLSYRPGACIVGPAKCAPIGFLLKDGLSDPSEVPEDATFKTRPDWAIRVITWFLLVFSEN
jgi:hypothetical protein